MASGQVLTVFLVVFLECGRHFFFEAESLFYELHWYWSSQIQFKTVNLSSQQGCGKASTIFECCRCLHCKVTVVFLDSVKS